MPLHNIWSNKVVFCIFTNVQPKFQPIYFCFSCFKLCKKHNSLKQNSKWPPAVIFDFPSRFSFLVILYTHYQLNSKFLKNQFMFTETWSNGMQIALFSCENIGFAISFWINNFNQSTSTWHALVLILLFTNSNTILIMHEFWYRKNPIISLEQRIIQNCFLCIASWCLVTVLDSRILMFTSLITATSICTLYLLSPWDWQIGRMSYKCSRCT
jgi:hypothetical protein